MQSSRNSRSPQRIKNADGSIRFHATEAQIKEAVFTLKPTRFGTARICVNGFTRQIIRGADRLRRQKLADQI